MQQSGIIKGFSKLSCREKLTWLRTSTRMEYYFDPEITHQEIQFRFEDEKTPTFRDRVNDFISSELVPFCDQGCYIHDRMGKDP